VTAFLTGSFAYGQPTPESDVDLVILVDKPTLDKLKEIYSNQGSCEHADADFLMVDRSKIDSRPLSLLFVTDIDRFHQWKKATDLCAINKVSKDYAKAVHKRMIKK
jgi:predicted nucleotidyltransferase